MPFSSLKAAITWSRSGRRQRIGPTGLDAQIVFTPSQNRRLPRHRDVPGWGRHREFTLRITEDDLELVFSGSSSHGDWYYTTNKQQMGPVSKDELKHLASKVFSSPATWSGRKGWRVVGPARRGFFEDREAPVPSAPARKPARRTEDEDEEDVRAAGPAPAGPMTTMIRTTTDDGRHGAAAAPKEGGMPVGAKVD